jgi:hypothetical protein
MWNNVWIAAKRKRVKELVNSLVGKSMNEAIKEINDAGLEAQLLEIDGVTMATNANFKPERLGLVINKGLVTGAQIG